MQEETPPIGPEPGSGQLHRLADHLFRHEWGKMVAVLTRTFGTENLELAEDVVQDTFLAAFQVWVQQGIPANPQAWLYRVARNKALNRIRHNRFSSQHDFSNPARPLPSHGPALHTFPEEPWEPHRVSDDMLRMMFACCHPGLPEEQQVTLILKTLCGFSTAEIARAFFCPEDTVSKRLYRGKAFFREHRIRPEIPGPGELQQRLEAVLHSVYLLFNEGYNSGQPDRLIRTDLMEEALLLGRLLTAHPETAQPATFALLALLCYQYSRSQSRLGADGNIILLDQQDRSQWNHEWIAAGNEYMNRAAVGNTVSAYHLQAAIAFEHCSAPDFAQTNWTGIVRYYRWLCRLSPSPVFELHMAVAVLHAEGTAAALRILEQMDAPKKMDSYYLYHSLLGEINQRDGRHEAARQHFEKALALTGSEAEKKMLRAKMERLCF